MYSPKISEDLIPRVYHVAKNEQVRMMAWVNRAVERELALCTQPESEPQQSKDNNGDEYPND